MFTIVLITPRADTPLQPLTLCVCVCVEHNDKHYQSVFACTPVSLVSVFCCLHICLVLVTADKLLSLFKDIGMCKPLYSVRSSSAPSNPVKPDARCS